MFPSPPKPRFEPGTRVQVVQRVRVGDRRWITRLVGVFEGESLRPVGGMEMGAKSLFSRQPTVRVRRDDGEITVVALDENTTIEPVSQ